MTNSKLFDGISEQDLEKMLFCFGAKKRTFSTGSGIPTRRYSEQQIGVLLSGEVIIARLDYDGNRNIFEHLAPGDVFGEIFMQTENSDDLVIVCEKKCEILYMDYKSIIKRCEKACPYHSRLVHNILQIMADKSKRIRTHLNILSQRSLRAKLLTYFNMVAKQAGSPSFTLPFTLADLADYLHVDRSAMLREMKNLREEGLIESHGKKVTLT